MDLRLNQVRVRVRVRARARARARVSPTAPYPYPHPLILPLTPPLTPTPTPNQITVDTVAAVDDACKKNKLEAHRARREYLEAVRLQETGSG